MLSERDTDSSILTGLTKYEIEEISEDYFLQKVQGYEPYFVIDADEVDTYCRPFDTDINRNLGRVSDEQFIIEYIFSAYKERIIFVNDYHEELAKTCILLNSTSNKKKVKEQVEKYRENLEEIRESLKDVSNFEKSGNRQEFLKKIIEAYSFLQFISNGNYENNLRKFRLLMSKQVSFEGRLKNNEIAEILSNYEIDSDLVNNILDDDLDKKESREIDIRALLKTYFLTKDSIKQNKKRIFYFVSSRTKDIKKIKEKIVTSDYRKDVFNLNETKTLIRSKAQLFGFLIYNLMVGKETEALSRVFAKFDQKSDSLRIIYGENRRDYLLFSLIKNEKKEKREILENLTIHYQKRKELEKENRKGIFNIKNFEKLLNSAVDKKDVVEIEKSLKQTLGLGEKLLLQEFGSDSLEWTLGKIKDYINILDIDVNLIREFIDFIVDNEKDLIFDRGADPIESIYSAFPQLFHHGFFDNRILPILQNVVHEKIPSSTELYKLTNYIVEENSINDVLICSLYLMLIIMYKENERGYSSNFIVYSYVNSLLEKKSQKSISIIEIPDVKLADIYAIGCWAARRSRKYKYAYSLSMRARDFFPDDPRFDFSLALNGYCWKYEFKTLERYEWSYEEYYDKENSILAFCESSIRKYQKLRQNERTSFANHFFISLLNLTAFCYVARYKSIYENLPNMDGSIRNYLIPDVETQNLLKQARGHVEEIKNLITLSSDEEDKEASFPEYLHTEVFLEYFEILNNQYLNKNTNQNKQKLKSALQNIDFAIAKIHKRIGFKKRCISLRNKLMMLES
ncbi:hypothetical protein KIM67_10680 [Flagellimonas sp. 389]|uniref:hypothetical protein n=1 Tax=Flagellimonas sp. 389 TaxID=2835862 RepID=UPI001BD3F2BC|nr:hypothetical protein [Flagellimonas sp. 389]MBS9462878.1 hypothetical protein [Flagellimonas sp. 389]